MQKCFCKNPLYQSMTHRFDGRDFCSFKCIEKYKKIKDYVKKAFTEYEETFRALADK